MKITIFIILAVLSLVLLFASWHTRPEVTDTANFKEDTTDIVLNFTSEDSTIFL
ncbi:MAG: hypothetical protein LBH25_14855 [Fibromonadaceae bacterium]|jgi:regulatory protein YycH of two-component signal transduction system YycFG|nr:hypothetical protein [Fibromonadaceae bacterium]